MKYAAEPAYEAMAGERSYGFRTGRSTHDAQKLIYNNLNSRVNGREKMILETDISKCFDEIDHQVILNKVVLPKEAIKGLRLAIKAGVTGEYPSSEKGTPQGGVISPLLANIALDGLENLGSDQWIGNRKDGTRIRGIRYADDAIFICKPGADIQKLRQAAKEAEKLRRKLLKGKAKPKGAAKRQATKLQLDKAFPSVPWKVNAHVMVKGAASPFDGNTPPALINGGGRAELQTIQRSDRRGYKATKGKMFTLQTTVPGDTRSRGIAPY